jgi:hypothetical protein
MIQDLSRDEVDRIMNTLKKEKGKQYFSTALITPLSRVMGGGRSQITQNHG